MSALSVNLRSLDEKVKFGAAARGNPEIVVDYFPPVGTGEGYTSLELLMASYGSCLGTTVATLLRHRMKKTVEGMAVAVEGIVREEHPKALRQMRVRLGIKSADLSEDEARQAVAAAEGLCPVWAMIRGNVDIEVEVEVSRP